VAFAPAIIARTGREDPGGVVIDELAGQSVVFTAAFVFAEMNPVVTAAVGFAAFRLFDIVKPFPVNKLEKLPAGWGILADDLMAGVYAALVVLFISHFWNYLNPPMI
jgi:phosphatidylglycerophosphatase A